MATASKAENDLAALKTTVTTISTLITQLQATAVAANPPPKENNSNVNALDLAHDSASLIKAHSTKLSLLIINKPFTATAITTVLRELISGPLPGLASAVEICTGARYTKAMASELQYRAKKVLKELETFVGAIPLDGKILSDDKKNGTGSERGKGSLASTGVVWQTCDAVMELKKFGVAGLIMKKAEEYRALLKDALEEMQEWGDEESGGEWDDGKVGSEGEDEDISAQDAADNIFGSQRHIPAEDPEKIRPRLESSQKKLKLVTLMYQAIIKRRFKSIPPIPQPRSPLDSEEKSSAYIASVLRLDKVIKTMKEIPDLVDELANAFYELHGNEIDKRMEECFLKACEVTDLLLKNWTGGEDEFTTWAGKFQMEMTKKYY